MPFVIRDGARIHWRTDGRPTAPALLLGNSLGTDIALWDPLIPTLAERFHVIRFDKRGHGASEVPPAMSEWTIDDLGRDALAVADAAGARRFSYMGISIGGMIGMWLGANAGDRIEHLVLSNTAAQMAATDWPGRIAAVRTGGMASLVDSVMQRWFTPGFHDADPVSLATIREHFLQVDPAGYAGCCAALRDLALADAPARITVPTLVIVGTHDASTPPEAGRAIAAAVKGSRLVELATAHIPHPEQHAAFLAAVMPHLAGSGAR